MIRCRFVAAVALALVLTGCNNSKDEPRAATPGGPTKTQTEPDEVTAERAKLDPADRALVEAQEWCVENTDERLGSMGPPMRLDIQGRPVFVCCRGCKKRAEADPGKTLAKVEELKAKAKAERDAK